MAGVLKLQVKANITGLGDEVSIDSGEETLTVPVEHGGQGLYIVHATATTTAMQISSIFPHIALTKMYGVYIKCIAGTIYVQLNTAGTTTFGSADAELVIEADKGGFWIPVNPANNDGITIDAAAITDAFIISAVGSA